MGAGEEILKQLAVINSKLDKLLSSPAGAPKQQDNELTDSFLDSQPWCDKPVRKDPPRWAGASCVGMMYSECPAEWHTENASFCEWKAQKGREDSPVRVNDKGKPWHEVDAFDAKISRAWARRNAAAKPATEPQGGSGDPPDIPF
jgi:hypothetical protein